MKKFTMILFALFASGWLTHAQLSYDNSCTTSFDDISATGTDLSLGDDGEANITLPFAFTLDGVSSSNLRVGNNGGVLFNATTGDVAISSTPTAQGFYPFSDDIDSDYGAVLWEVLGTAPNRRAVVLWNDRPHYSNSASGATFELILYETSNEITFLYQDTIFDTTADDAVSAGIRVVGANGTYVYSTDTALGGVTCINWVVPTCPNVSGVTIDSFNASSANVSWTSNGSESDWEIAFQAGGAGEPAGSGTATTSNPHIQISLSPDTVYDVYVRANCGGGDFGDWVGPVSFTTSPIAPPSCVSTYNATPDASCGNEDTILSWDAVTADGYYITVGSTTGGNDILDNVDLGNVTSTTVSSQSANTTYYYTISPYNVVGTNTTCTEQTYTTFATGCLCTSVPTSIDGDGISNVRVGLTDYATSAVSYTDHTGTAEDLGQGVLANVDITFETGYGYGVSIWIDFNDNLTFEASELVFDGAEGTGTDPEEYNADFTMPGSAALGTHKMRIVTADVDANSENPCYSGSYGVTLDFDVNITAVACTPATIASTTVVENCGAGTYVVEVEVTDLGSGPGSTLFVWGSSFDPVVLGTNTAGPFNVGDSSGNIDLIDTLDNTCSINLGAFGYNNCPITSFPWTEDFEGITTPALPDSWSELNNNADGDAFITYATYGVSASNAAGLYTDFNGGSNDDYLILPAFTLTGNERLKFNVRTRNTGEPDEYRVVLSTTGTNAADFSTELQALTSVASTTHTEISPIDLSAYTGDVYIAIHVPNTSTDGYYIYFDDFTVEAIPTCLDVTAVTTSSITPNSVTIDWTNGGAETAWEVAVQAAGTGEPALADNSGTDTAVKPYVQGSLTAETDYEVWVRADCGGGDLGTWSGPVNFTTPCAAITPNYTADMSTSLPDSCWEQAGDGEVVAGPSGTGTSDWTTGSYGIGSSNKINLYTGNTDREWLLSPVFDVSGGTYQLEINVAVTNYNNGAADDTMGSDDEVQLLQSIDGGTTWTNLTTWNAGNEPDFTGTEYIEDLSALTGDVQFAVWASDGTTDDTEDYDFHVGKFVVRTPPTCGDISAITIDTFDDTTAQISWTDAEGETDWEIAVQAAGTGAPGAADNSGTDTTTNPHSVSSLTGATAYEVYVRADCSGDGSNLGAWVGPVNFTTLATPPNGPTGVTCVTGSSSIIFTEDFDAVGDWTGSINSGNDSWEIPDGATSTATGADTAYSGANYMNWEASGNNTNTGSIVSPAIDLTPATDGAELAFYMHAYGADMGTLNIGVSISGNTGPFTNEFTWTGQLQTSGADAWTPVGVDLSAYIGNTIHIQFSQTGSGGTNYSGDMSIDLMTVEACGPYCVDPTAIVASNITGTSADIAWTENGSATDWEIAVQAAGTGEPAAADGSGTDTTTNPHSVSGLSPVTDYEVYVRAECAAGTSFSGWAGPYNFTTTVLCPDVTGLTIDSYADTTAEISWTAGGGTLESGWDIVIQADGTGSPELGTIVAATNPYSATGLTAETDYEVYVRANCDTDGYSDWVGPVDFTTACSSIIPEYIADMSNNAPDSCWVEAGDGDEITGPTDLGSGLWYASNHGGTPSNVINLYFNNRSDWIISPVFDLSTSADSELLVYVALTNSGTSGTGESMGSDDAVKLLMTTDGGTSWSTLETWAQGSEPSEVGESNAYNLPTTGNSSVQFAFYGTDGDVNDLEDVYFHVSSFVVREIPSCPDVTAITASNITTTSADIGWTNGASETAWEVAVQAAGTGEPGAADGAGTDSATNPYSASGLTANTDYEVYVRAECTAGVDFGAWVGPFNFTTPCDAVSDFSEDFDSVTTPNLPGCWSGIVDNGASSFASVTTSTSADNSLPNGVSLYNSNSASTSNMILVSPVLSNLGDGTHRLKFNGRNSTATQDVEVGTLSDPTDGSTFTALTTVDLSTTFSEYEVSFAGYSGSDTYIGIRRLSTSTYTYVYLDDITWEEIPSCLAVSNITVGNITTTSADINWTDADSETAWEVAIQAAGTGEPGAADGSGTDSATNPYNATGLTVATSYEVWVRAECVAGVDFGAWVGPIDFETTCDTFSTFPYTEGFESGVPPLCWTSFRGTNGEGTVYDWTTSATANTGSGAAYVRYENVTNEAEDWLVTPAFDLSSLSNPELTFYSRDGIATDYGSEFTIRVSTTNTDIASFTTVETYSEFDNLTYQQLSVDLSAYNSDTTVYIAFVLTNDDGDSFYLDDVVIWDNAPGTYTYTDGVWSPFAPANDLDDIIIASGDLVISSDFNCNTMTVNPGASVTVNSGTTLEATNGLTLESSSTSYSSLIRNGSIVGTLEYERHVNINGSGTTGSNDLVSAPLTGQAFNVFAAANPNILSNAGNTLFLFGPFNKGTGSYVTWANTETSTLDPGVGYRAGSTDNGTFTFTGTDNIGDVTHDITNSGPNNAEWNLVGNPYPAYLNVQNFLAHDVGGVVNIQLFDGPTAAIYGYDGSALNGWTIYNLANTTASTVIAPGQGFMVSADATNAPLYDLEFTASMRRTGNSDDFIVGRNAALTYLTLNVSANSKSYNTEFYFNNNATQGFDLGYDANVWGNTAPEFAIYSHLVQDNAGEPVALQTLSSTDLNDVTIALGVNANQGEQITFSIADMTIPASVNVYLEDVVKNTITLLNDSDYVFTPTTDLSGTGRFFLRTSDDALSNVENSLDKLDIYTLKASDELVVSGQIQDNNTILNLYDIQGRLVLSNKLDDATLENRINVSSISSGVYVVTILNNSQEKTKKVIID